MSVTIQYDGEYKGNEYTFDRISGHWHCSKSRNWRMRYLRAYIILECKLRDIAIARGVDPVLLTKYKEPVVEKPKKKKSVSTPKNFISLF